MAVKNFIFRKNWVGKEVASMKIAFFAIFDPPWTTFWLGFLKQSFNFQSLRKTEAVLLSIM